MLTRSGPASCAASAAPASKLRDGSATSVAAHAIRVFPRQRAVATMQSSVTSVPAISPAVEARMMRAFG